MHIFNGVKVLARYPVVLERVKVLEQLGLCCFAAVVDSDPLGDLMDENQMDGEVLHTALGEGKRGCVVLNSGGQAAGQVAMK